jgi:hypothetical protein
VCGCVVVWLCGCAVVWLCSMRLHECVGMSVGMSVGFVHIYEMCVVSHTAI